MGSRTTTKETKIRNKDLAPLYSTTIKVEMTVLRLVRDGSVSMVGPADGMKLSAERKNKDYTYAWMTGTRHAVPLLLLSP
jgi:hypothetical protein